MGFLLVKHGLVSGEEDLKTIILGSLDKLAVLQPGPALVVHREYFVTGKMVP